MFQEILLPSSLTLHNDGSSISPNVASLNILVHDVINLYLLYICAVLVFNLYWSVSDKLSLGWLPIEERTEMRIANLFYQALNSKNFPEYLIKITFSNKKTFVTSIQQ